MIRLSNCWFTLLAIMASITSFSAAQAQRDSQVTTAISDAGFESIFNGSSLEGWTAVPATTASDWTVKSGAIVGVGSADRQNYLVWQDRQLADFELKLQFRLLTDGNTGVEIRAIEDVTGRRPFQGYHADFGHAEIGPNVLGAWDFHFGKQRREHACPRGTILEIDRQDQPQTLIVPDALTSKDVHDREWNDVHIVAQGNSGKFTINGKFASKFTDNYRPQSFSKGAIGLQLHERGMHVEFRNLRIKRLP